MKKRRGILVKAEKKNSSSRPQSGMQDVNEPPDKDIKNVSKKNSNMPVRMGLPPSFRMFCSSCSTLCLVSPCPIAPARGPFGGIQCDGSLCRSCKVCLDMLCREEVCRKLARPRVLGAAAAAAAAYSIVAICGTIPLRTRMVELDLAFPLTSSRPSRSG